MVINKEEQVIISRVLTTYIMKQMRDNKLSGYSSVKKLLDKINNELTNNQ